MFWELEKAIFRPEKDKWWIWGSKTPKPLEMPTKLGKTSQHHNWPRYLGWPQIGPKIAIKQPKGHVSDIFFCFLCFGVVGKGRRSPRRKAGGFLFEIEKGWWGVRGAEAGWGARGLGSVCGRGGG